MGTLVIPFVFHDANVRIFIEICKGVWEVMSLIRWGFVAYCFFHKKTCSHNEQEVGNTTKGLEYTHNTKCYRIANAYF